MPAPGFSPGPRSRCGCTVCAACDGTAAVGERSLRGFLLGIGSAGTLLATQAMLPDIMEYDRRRTGLRREGVYAGLASFIEKISSSLSGIVIGGLLSAMNFDRNLGPEEQPDSARTAIYICVALIPMLMYALKLVLLYFFKLDERTLKSATSVVATTQRGDADVT